MTSRAPSTPLTEDQRRWLGELYESNHATVFRLCARILRDPEEAADACQEVFIVASTEFVAGTLPANPRVWLLAVARNHCLDLLRRRKRFGKVLTTIGSSLEDSVNPEATVIGRQSVDSVLRELSPRERQALWQSAVERRPLADIANGLQLNYMAAAQVLSRARRHAALAMARVAAILAGLRVYRRITQPGGVPRSAIVTSSLQLAALAVVPLVIAATQSSSNARDNQPALTAMPSLTAPRTGLTVASTDHRGVGSAILGPAGGQLAALPNPLDGGLGGFPSVGNSVLYQLTTLVPNIARGLPPVPVVPVNPTLPPTPKVP